MESNEGTPTEKSLKRALTQAPEAQKKEAYHKSHNRITQIFGE